MRVVYDGYNWLVRLDKGELLIKTLTEVAAKERISAAWITGLGGAQWAELGFYDLKNQVYLWQKFKTLLEIISIQGNIALMEDKPILHLHGTLSDRNMQTIGGHIKELEVAGTCEVMIHRWHGDNLTRTLSEEVGLNTLKL